MKILHVATFIGNIGDNASHIGFKEILEENLGTGHQIDTLEIRKTYAVYTLPDKWRFDMDFAKKANEYDLLLIGGGHFLDFWVKNSHTGTTLDISDEVLSALKVPIMIISMGCMHRTDVPEENVPKLRRFLDKLLERKQTAIAVRNDGSKKILKDIVGQVYFENIPEVLDSGFFYDTDAAIYTPSDKPYVIMNSTVDQLSMKSRIVGEIDSHMYVDEMGKVINHFLNETDLNVVFAPHIYADYKAIDTLLQQVNDFHIRTRITLTPYVQDDFGCNMIFSAYKNSSLVVGMRFHANVCSLSMNKASVGVAATDRVVNAYNSIGLVDRIVQVDKPFSEEIIRKSHHALQHRAQMQEECKNNLSAKRLETKAIYKQMFDKIKA
jgi:polysaccharide pyruvyl transferase WcaK-like protein